MYLSEMMSDLYAYFQPSVEEEYDEDEYELYSNTEQLSEEPTTISINPYSESFKST
jgi:hypothetical protein